MGGVWLVCLCPYPDVVLQRNAGHVDARPHGDARVAVLANDPAVNAARVDLQKLRQLVAEAAGGRVWSEALVGRKLSSSGRDRRVASAGPASHINRATGILASRQPRRQHTGTSRGRCRCQRRGWPAGRRDAT